MPQIDFYILSSGAEQARLGTACRIIEKAARQCRRIVIATANPSQAKTLDELLWTFSDTSFIPHRIATPDTPAQTASPTAESADDTDEPVLIHCGDAGQTPACDVLVNLGDRLPESVDACPRIVEIISSAPDVRQQGRDRYKAYRARGYELNVHNL